MQNRLRVKLALSFFGTSLVGAAIPLVAQRLLDDAVMLWLVTGLGVVGLGLLGSSLLVESLSANVRSLAAFAGKVSQGDLSQQAKSLPAVGTADEDDLARAINFMLQNLRDLVTHLHRTSTAVADSAKELSATASGVSASTEEVITTIEQIARGAELQTQLVDRASKIITEIANGIERTARAAEDAAVASHETASVAQSGGTVGKMAVDKLRKVFEKIETTADRVVLFGEKSKEISKIVEVITKLSQQTNLLALNATIEAARAGEYGRGFAVVADEIRKLAENSAGSADQIGKLIEESVGEAHSAITSMQESTRELTDGREDMNSIIRSLENITVTALKGVDVVSQISRITNDQFEGAREMVTAMNNISQVAASNARGTEEVSAAIDKQSAPMQQMTASATDLSNLSHELEAVVTRFQLQRERQEGA